MSKTLNDLKDAFAGESQANRKYLAFAKEAEKENKPYAAIIFKAAAEAETIHAHSHLHAMNGVGNTESNLKAAIEGEQYEFTTMYPEMIQHAKEEKNQVAERSMTMASEAEKIHAEFFKKALANPSQAAPKVYVCQICGNIVENNVPDDCSICHAKGAMFKEVK